MNNDRVVARPPGSTIGIFQQTPDFEKATDDAVPSL
jgi:hypothetical protein